VPQTAHPTSDHSDTKHLGETQAGCDTLKSPSRGRHIHASVGEARERDLPAVTLHTKAPGSQLQLPQAVVAEGGRASVCPGPWLQSVSVAERECR